MKSYNVKEVAEILGTNPETIRRWIRDGKLEATKGASKREGSSVSESQLQKFLLDSPKYAGMAAATVAKSTPAALIPLTVFGVAGLALGTALEHAAEKKAIENSSINTPGIVSYLEGTISDLEKTIQSKKSMIAQLEDEIASAEKQITATKITIDQLLNQ